MDNFNLQKFVKKSKNEFYTNLYEGKKEHSMEEEMHDDDHKMEEKMHDDHKMEENHQSLDPQVAERIEGLLNIPMKAKFLNAGVDLIADFLEDEMMDVGDIVSHLANELEKRVAFGTPSGDGELEEGEIEDETEGINRDQSQSSSLIGRMGDISLEDNPFDTENDDESAVEEVSMNASDLETAMALLGGILGLPAVAILSQKAQDKLKAMKAKGKEALTEEEEIDVDIEDEIPGMDVDLDMSTDKPDNKEVFSQLVDAYESAKELGDEKLTRQLANTITYFNKTIIFGDEA